jgi:hypothetical protein
MSPLLSQNNDSVSLQRLPAQEKILLQQQHRRQVWLLTALMVISISVLICDQILLRVVTTTTTTTISRPLSNSVVPSAFQSIPSLVSSSSYNFNNNTNSNSSTSSFSSSLRPQPTVTMASVKHGSTIPISNNQNQNEIVTSTVSTMGYKNFPVNRTPPEQQQHQTSSLTTTTFTTRNDTLNGIHHDDDDNNHKNNLVVTLLVGLSGEFGNHLQKLARAYGIVQLAYQEYHITMQIVLQQQQQQRRRRSDVATSTSTTIPNMVLMGKAISTQKHLQQCFDSMKTLDFGLGYQLRLIKQQQQQQRVNPDDDDHHPEFHFLDKTSISLEGENWNDLRINLEKLAQYLMMVPKSKDDTAPLLKHQTVNNSNNSSNAVTTEIHYHMHDPPSAPMVVVETNSIQEDNFLVDRYYDAIRQQFLVLNETSCGCSRLRHGNNDHIIYPDPDESVFHYRGFATEMPKAYRTKGYQELSPYKIAYQLFGNLQAGDKIALVGRFVNQETKTRTTISSANHNLTTNTNTTTTTTTATTQQIVTALQSRGLIVRVITGGDVGQDFCFLQRAQKELVGMARSTFVKWAFLLGNASMTRLYLVDSPLMQKAMGSPKQNNTKQQQQEEEKKDWWNPWNYTWAHPDLRSRFRFEVYPSDEQ